ncbi:MAG TPA: tripartite tricarboxylate transporter substrate binding protein [Afifellaceae bacterium]|nr:tripartite tricarboxylate transporter substrate binding protein [Afifellaceae bacterium]
MFRKTRRAIVASAVALGLAAGIGGAQAQEYPEKPITMVIPLGAGGSHDLNARVMTSVISSYLGQPVVVQLMPGAGGQTGTAAAAQAAADGYTLLFTHNFIDELQQHVTNVPYDPNSDFVAVARTNTGPGSVVVRADAPWQTIEEFLEYGKQNPGQIKFGHSGNWGAAMVPGAALLSAAGIQATLVPYQGGGPAMQGVLSGDVDFTVAFPSVVTAQGDQVRALVTIGDSRIFEDVPTTAEAGFPDVTEIGLMHRVVLAPAGTPEDRLAKLRDAFAQLKEDETYKTLLTKIDENNEFMDGAEYDEVRKRQSEAYKKLVESLAQ